MDWMRTNDEELPAWSDRTTPASDTQARPGGVALEHIIDLCNQLGASAWVNVHHLANDAYVTSMASMLRDQLRPDVQIYVEHSNEVGAAGREQLCTMTQVCAGAPRIAAQHEQHPG